MKLTFKDGTSIEIINNSFREFDKNNNLIHYKDSSGIESWYNSTGNQITKQQFELKKKQVTCENKLVEIDGVKYKLTLA